MSGRGETRDTARIQAFADVAQLVEHWLPKPGVAGSTPVVRFSVAEPKPSQMRGFLAFWGSHSSSAQVRPNGPDSEGDWCATGAQSVARELLHAPC